MKLSAHKRDTFKLLQSNKSVRIGIFYWFVRKKKSPILLKNYWNAWLVLSNKWHLEALKPTLTVSPTLILESPSVSTTKGSPSFSRYRKVPDPNFSTTKTLLSQLASPSWMISKCSGSWKTGNENYSPL